MPFVTVKIAGPVEAEEVVRLQRGVTALITDILGKKAELTAILVERTEPGAWTIGAERMVIAAHLDATVTAGTNDADEKARFVAAAHALLRDALGSTLPLATYVVLTEVAGGSWGYGGLTQAERATRRAVAT